MKNGKIGLILISVWAVCGESCTYSSEGGKVCEDLPIPTRDPDISHCQRWMVVVSFLT